MTGYFDAHAPRLAAAGYDVIPISRPDDPTYKDAGKQPAQRSGWQHGCQREDWPQYADCGLGILTRATPAIDIDVLHPKLAVAIQALADRHLGKPPVRIGQPPKRLMPFQLRGPEFTKMRVSWRGFCDTAHPPDKPPAVEILATGQQFVALGIHPGTGHPYAWRRDPDLSLPHGLLPPLDVVTAAHFIEATASAVRRLGATDIKISGIRRPEHPARAVLLTAVGSRADALRAALERQGNPDLHYDDWIKLGHAIKAELPGMDGLAIWEWFSSLSSKNDPPATARKWHTFRPERVTAGTIFWSGRR